MTAEQRRVSALSVHSLSSNLTRVQKWLVWCLQTDLPLLSPPPPPPPSQASELLDDRTDTYLRAIRDVLTPRLQLVVCVFPTIRDDRYSAVKKLCCCERPVPSQCINSRTIGNQQKLKSVTQKIVLQVGGVRVRLGGVGWGLFC